MLLLSARKPCRSDTWGDLSLIPKVSKVPKYGVSMAPVLGIAIIVLGRYLVFGYLDP